MGKVKEQVKGVKVSHIIKTSFVTAFTIATAFIWKDVVIEPIEFLFPTSKQLFYKFIVAILATLFITLLIFVFLETEYEFEFLINKIRKPKKENNKKRGLRIKGVKILKV